MVATAELVHRRATVRWQRAPPLAAESGLRRLRWRTTGSIGMTPGTTTTLRAYHSTRTFQFTDKCIGYSAATPGLHF